MTGDLAAHEIVPSADVAAMYRRFEDEPGDRTAYGVTADMLDDCGWDSLAHAFRWMCGRGKWPHRREWYALGGGATKKVPAKYRFAWYREGLTTSTTTGGIALPKSEFASHALPPLVIPGGQMLYPSHQAAVMALAKWLQELRDAIAVEPARRRL